MKPARRIPAAIFAAALVLLPTAAFSVPSWWTTGTVEQQLNVLLVYAEYFYNYSAFLLGFIAAVISASIWRG